MPSPFVDIQAAIATLLLQAPPIAGDRVFRGRVRPMKAGQATAIAVRLIRTEGRNAGVGLSAPKDWTTLYGIECVARVEPDDVPEDTVDALVTAAYARLATVGAALALSVEDVLPDPSIVWDVEEGETAIARATFVVQVVHRTQAAALVAWP